MLVLPKEKNKPKVNNPRFLILYGKPINLGDYIVICKS